MVSIILPTVSKKNKITEEVSCCRAQKKRRSFGGSLLLPPYLHVA